MVFDQVTCDYPAPLPLLIRSEHHGDLDIFSSETHGRSFVGPVFYGYRPPNRSAFGIGRLPPDEIGVCPFCQRGYVKGCSCEGYLFSLLEAQPLHHSVH